MTELGIGETEYPINNEVLNSILEVIEKDPITDADVEETMLAIEYLGDSISVELFEENPILANKTLIFLRKGLKHKTDRVRAYTNYQISMILLDSTTGKRSGLDDEILRKLVWGFNTSSSLSTDPITQKILAGDIERISQNL